MFLLNIMQWFSVLFCIYLEVRKSHVHKDNLRILCKIDMTSANIAINIYA